VRAISAGPRRRAPGVAAGAATSNLPSSDFGDEIDLDASAERNLRDAERGARVDAGFAEHLTEQHLVTNGASELIADVFGERGKHARSAFGVAQIPLGACVEIEMIAEVE
jgi:hypothetical protein